MSNALADLGASISVMPYSLFKRLGLGSLKPIRMTIEMADRSMQSPKGIKENVLVKISNFVFPVDFIILDIMEDENVPIILGRPMLAISLVKIDVYETAEIKEYFSMTPNDPDQRMSIGLEDFVDMEDMWDDLDPGILTNEKAKTEFLKSGSRIHVHSTDNLQLSCKIGFVNFNPYVEPQTPFNIMSMKAYNTIMKHELMYSGINMVGLAKNLHMFIGNHQFLVDFIILENISEFVEKGLTEVLFGRPFKEQIGLVEDRGKGILWFKIVMKIREEESISLKKIKGFYRGCLSLGNEYKYDQEVVDWIRGCINDEMT
ncbi:homeodomain-like protein [Tanacetum coccineum]